MEILDAMCLSICRRKGAFHHGGRDESHPDAISAGASSGVGATTSHFELPSRAS